MKPAHGKPRAVSYTAVIRSITMNNVYKGSTGQFKAVLQANGQDYVPPAGAAPIVWKWTTDGDGPATSISPIGTDTSTANLTVDLNESGTFVNITVTCTAPDGKAITTTFQVNITDMPVTYTGEIIQTGMQGPAQP